ncbi:LysE family transporter [Dickeya fangzhongdai]|uniref:LysE family translocator n=1 Tax=Dickeya fangzhongdai TaxID=1778540 RepID=UPI000676A495|nr:LysE family transporter [Dickeya fangzhongdai]WES90940.1 LysE family transporter [Dickeya fangzhongdai]WOY01848.1 LysE family transporter [Dickeya fangzhongdai]
MGSDILAIAAIGGVLALGAMSPGQSFILVARTALASSRRNSLAVSLGMGVGAAIFALVALLGLQSLLLAVPWLYQTLKIAGGIYLLYLAFTLFRARPDHAAPALHSGHEPPQTHAFRLGLLTQLSNPNTALVFGGVFAALLSQHIADWMYVALPLLAFVIDFLWYALVALLLSSSGPRGAYLRFRTLFDRLSGTVMAALGIRLLLQK